MPTYVALASLTEQGIRDAKNIVRRMGEARHMLESFGVKVKELHLITGPYDYVGIFEAPDDETMAKATLSVAMRGNVRTQTFRAFSSREVSDIIGDVR